MTTFRTGHPSNFRLYNEIETFKPLNTYKNTTTIKKNTYLGHFFDLKLFTTSIEFTEQIRKIFPF